MQKKRRRIRAHHMAILFHNKTFFTIVRLFKSREKMLANQNIKLDWQGPVFNVRFYYYDGRFYYSIYNIGEHIASQ